jgi:glycosyltransferase involved in cell wall biosynthesis
LYKSSKIFVSTSKNEGFGLTLTEALQNSLIPIAFNSYKTINEIIIDNKNGFLIEENKIADFTNKLFDVTSNYNDYSYIISNQKQSLSKFSNKTYFNKFSNILK